MKQAKPSAEQCEQFLRFMQGLESIVENAVIENDDGEEFAIEDDFDLSEWLFKQWKTIGPIWQRVFYAGQTAIDNACDPNADTLEWKPELQRAAEMADILKEIARITCAFECEPVEQPTDEGPWLPCGLMSRIHEVLK